MESHLGQRHTEQSSVPPAEPAEDGRAELAGKVNSSRSDRVMDYYCRRPSDGDAGPACVQLQRACEFHESALAQVHRISIFSFFFSAHIL